MFYLDPGSAEDRNKWILFFQGGAGCATDATCLRRTRGNPDLITSSKEPATVVGSGILSRSASVNPDFAGYTRVYVHYCSSDFWAGNTSHRIGRSTWEFRGTEIVKALLDQLVKRSIDDAPTLRQATDVVVAGSSAGAHAVHNNLDRIAAALPWAKVKGIADAGWTPAEIEPFGPGVVDVRTDGPEAMAYHAAQPDDSCVAANRGRAGLCLNENFVFPYVDTPMFVIADQRDPTLLSMMGVTGNQPASAGQQAYLTNYARLMRESMRDVPAYYLTNISRHTSLLTPRFNTVRIGGRTAQETIGSWHAGHPGTVQLIGKPGEGLNPGRGGR